MRLKRELPANRTRPRVGDFRPSNQTLYGISVQNRVYTLNQTTGAATPVGTEPFMPSALAATDAPSVRVLVATQAVDGRRGPDSLMGGKRKDRGGSRA